jgi:hypothetical protein
VSNSKQRQQLADLLQRRHTMLQVTAAGALQKIKA